MTCYDINTNLHILSHNNNVYNNTISATNKCNFILAIINSRVYPNSNKLRYLLNLINELFVNYHQSNTSPREIFVILQTLLSYVTEKREIKINNDKNYLKFMSLYTELAYYILRNLYINFSTHIRHSKCEEEPCPCCIDLNDVDVLCFNIYTSSNDDLFNQLQIFIRDLSRNTDSIIHEELYERIRGYLC